MALTRYHAAVLAALGTAACLSPGAAGARQGLRDGSFTGDMFSAYYGEVQVRAEIRRGTLSNIKVLRHPSDRFTSRIISARSLPVLEREVIQAQSARVDTVSGATLTSRAFLRSLQSALDRAR